MPEEQRVPFKVATKPAPEPRPRNLRPLRKIRWRARLGSPTIRREQRAIARRAAENGSPWYGEGLLANHITPGIFTPVGLCLRPCESTSSARIPTLLGVVCRRCVSLWNAGVVAVDAEIADTNRLRDPEDPAEARARRYRR